MGLAVGIIVGKVSADVTFYVPTIISYELRRRRGLAGSASRMFGFGALGRLAMRCRLSLVQAASPGCLEALRAAGGFGLGGDVTDGSCANAYDIG
jgi:hypothetical protein